MRCTTLAWLECREKCTVLAPHVASRASRPWAPALRVLAAVQGVSQFPTHPDWVLSLQFGRLPRRDRNNQAGSNCRRKGKVAMLLAKAGEVGPGGPRRQVGEIFLVLLYPPFCFFRGWS